MIDLRHRASEVAVGVAQIVFVGIVGAVMVATCHRGCPLAHGNEGDLSAAIQRLQPEAVERGDVRGARGEIGLLQLHGVALGYRPTECTSELEWRGDPERRVACQVLTGARFLAAVRDHCGGSTWRWVASYGASRCLTDEEAREHRSARNARRYYLQIGGDLWPE